MKVLTNKKIKSLLVFILLCIIIFILAAVTFICIIPGNAAIYITVCSLGMGMLIIAACLRYFNEQDKVMENIVGQIQEYIYGGRNFYIECDDEGGVYKLFHEINSLVSIMDAHIENERKSKKFLKNTISDISHQLKTPLAALNIYNGIIQEEAVALPSVKEFAELSENQLDRIETLVQNLLKITKFDAGTVVIEKSIENVLEIMESIKKSFLFRTIQEKKEICLEGDSTIVFLCDRNWIIEAISNIVKNALGHMETGGLVYITWKQPASVLHISIEDNGSGIYPEDFYHIFKRFYRSRYSKDTQGTGLGLPLAKSIIEAHNGTIKADSKLGNGTVFNIDFII